MTAVNWLEPAGPDRDLRDDRPHPRRLRGVRAPARCRSRATRSCSSPASSASTKAGASDPHLNLGVVVIGSFVAAVAGAQVGYWIGKLLRHARCSSPTPASSRRSTSNGRRSSSSERGTAAGRARALHPVRAHDRPDARGRREDAAAQVRHRQRDRRRDLGRRHQPARLLARQARSTSTSTSTRSSR